MGTIIQQTQHKYNIHITIRTWKDAHIVLSFISLVSLLAIVNFSASQRSSQQWYYLESPPPYESGLEFANKRHLYYSLKIGRESKAWGPEEWDEIYRSCMMNTSRYISNQILHVYAQNMYKNLHKA